MGQPDTIVLAELGRYHFALSWGPSLALATPTQKRQTHMLSVLQSTAEPFSLKNNLELSQ